MAGLTGWFSKLWKGVATAVAIAAFGPIGGAVAAGLIAMGEGKGWWRGQEPNSYVQYEVLKWRDLVYNPYLKKILPLVSGTPTAPGYIGNLNNILENLSAWRAFYEYKTLKETDEDEVSIAFEKIGLIDGIVNLIIESYQKFSPLPGLSFFPYEFDPRLIKEVAGEQLNWNGVKSVTATKWFLTDKPHGGTPPNGGGGTTIGGGGTQTGGGGTTTGGGGTTIGGGGTTTGGGGTQTGGGGTTTGGGGTTTGGGGTGGTKPPLRPIEYFRLSQVEKKIYTEWEKNGLAYYQEYRRKNPAYIPSPELLKLLGIKDEPTKPTRPTGPNPNNPWNYLPAPSKKNHTITVVAIAIGAAFILRRTRNN